MVGRDKFNISGEEEATADCAHSRPWGVTVTLLGARIRLPKLAIHQLVQH